MRRVPELDALRGLAATTILLYHLRASTFFCGWAAVDLFFVLSGYLITSIVLSNSSSTNFVFAFYARRSLRIWPIYYLAIGAVLLINLFLPNPFEIGRGVLYYLTYTQNVPSYWGGDNPVIRPLAHTWSLAIEEQFYLIWPALICLAGRKRFVPVAFAVLALAVGARMGGFHLRLLITRCDGFALGGLLAALFTSPVPAAQRPWARPLFLAVGALSLAYLVGGVLVYGGQPFMGKPDAEDLPMWPGLTILFFNLFFFSLIGLVVTYSGHPLLRPLRSRWLGYLGQISYGLYLYHWIVYVIARQLMEYYGFQHSTKFDLLRFVVSFAVAALSWRYIERPILSLKDRFRYGAAPARPQPQPALVVAPSPVPPRPRTWGVGALFPLRSP
jgi:peptidoglycan/LPS O-acetylase OafA/YrhL